MIDVKENKHREIKMSNLYNHSNVLEILHRIDQLTPNSQKLWGSTSVEQMLSHLNAFLETTLDLNSPKRLLIGRFIGSFFKQRYVSVKQFSINSRTHKDYIITDFPNFELEKAKSIRLIEIFVQGGFSKCTSKPHPFFGKLTPEEWGIVQWKHFDHHLRQFGV